VSYFIRLLYINMCVRHIEILDITNINMKILSVINSLLAGI